MTIPILPKIIIADVIVCLILLVLGNSNCFRFDSPGIGMFSSVFGTIFQKITKRRIMPLGSVVLAVNTITMLFIGESSYVLVVIVFTMLLIRVWNNLITE